jgi:hypothetical protein
MGFDPFFVEQQPFWCLINYFIPRNPRAGLNLS